MKRCAFCDQEYDDAYDGCPACAGAVSRARLGAAKWRSYALFLVIVAPVAIFAWLVVPPAYALLWIVFWSSLSSAALLVLLLSPLAVLLSPVRVAVPIAKEREVTFDD